MDFDFLTWNNLMYLIGEITVIIILGALLTAFILVIISLYSIKKGRLYFPTADQVRTCLLRRADESILPASSVLKTVRCSTFLIKLHNTMNTADFERIPVAERAIFMPQCLRSSKCPAHLTPEGLKCRSCGQCTVGEARMILEKMGYRIFIVPGSSFIKRMVKKYHPKAIIGVGCLSEVKEGIDMADKMGLVVMGVVTLKEGCVETLVNWTDVYEVAMLGIDPASIPEDLHILTD